MAHKKIPMEHDKKIALVAHDNKKRDLLEWAKFNVEWTWMRKSGRWPIPLPRTFIRVTKCAGSQIRHESRVNRFELAALLQSPAND